jgi:hypothetical protein
MTMKELLELPVVVDVRTAARAFGIGKSAAYEMAAVGTFPCPVLRLGRQYRVTRSHLFATLGLDPAIVAGHSASGADEIVRVPDQPDSLSGDAVRALYEALMAAAQVLVDRNAAP